MAKLSLLEITQDILNDMDSDQVNGIDDTIESQQVAQIVKTCYFEMIANRNWPHLRKLIQLDALNDLTKPTYFKLPNEMKELVFFKYDVHKSDSTQIEQREVRYKEPDAFLRYTSYRNSNQDHTVAITDFSGSQILIFDNAAPTFWTSFDDLHIVCDSYDATVDDTLKQSKSQALAYMEPIWSPSNDFIPDLPSEAFPALVEEAKSTAMFKLKQMVDTKAEQKAARQQRWLSRKAWRAHGGVQYADFGRKGRR